MKKLLLGLLMLPTLAFASGRLSFEPEYDAANDRFNPKFGLGIYEKVVPGFAYNSWTGYGERGYEDRTRDTNWFVTKQGFDFYVGAFTFYPNVQLFYNFDTQRWEDRYAVKATYQLW